MPVRANAPQCHNAGCVQTPMCPNAHVSKRPCVQTPKCSNAPMPVYPNACRSRCSCVENHIQNACRDARVSKTTSKMRMPKRPPYAPKSMCPNAQYPNARNQQPRVNRPRDPLIARMPIKTYLYIPQQPMYKTEQGLHRTAVESPPPKTPFPRILQCPSNLPTRESGPQVAWLDPQQACRNPPLS